MKRLYVDSEELTCWDNLLLAMWKAAKGKRSRPDIREFVADYENRLGNLQAQIRNLQLPVDDYRCFRIHDPKPRNIVAVGFGMRVVHHAIMNRIGDSLERSQIHNSFACLPKRGVHAAVHRVQRGLRRAEWYVKIDIDKYFDNIDHHRLKEKLARRFKGNHFLSLLDLIIDGYRSEPEKGLPIGSLTSQYFANFYLERFDRFIEQLPTTKGYVRYMDDMIWFCDNKISAKETLDQAIYYLQDEGLKVKVHPQIQLCRQGVGYCGFRIGQQQIRLTRRKKRAYRRHLLRWQGRWQRGEIHALQLQRGYDAVHAITYPARSRGFRRSVLATTGTVEA